MSSAVGKAGQSAAATRTFGHLRIDKRVLSTTTRTIAIANVCNISVGTHVERQPRVMWAVLMLVCLAVAYASGFGGGLDSSFQPGLPTIIAGVLAAGFLYLALKPDDKTHYLLISTNDGVLSRFTGPDRSVLEEARELLSAKINDGDGQSSYSINFETGVIETLTGGNTAGSPPGNGAARSSVAAAGTSAGSGGDSGGGPSHRLGGRPGDASGRGLNGSSGNGNRPNETGSAIYSAIDYGRVLPVVVEMHRFYQRQPGTEHLAQRLEELELLMRSGAQTSAQKTRVHELSQELAQILGAYPQVVKVFHEIRGMTVTEAIR